MASSQQPRPGDSHSSGASRQVFVFLLAADITVLLIYLLVLPSGQWESVDSRVKAIGSLVASGLAYFGLDQIFKKRADDYAAFMDSAWFRSFLVLVTPVLWLGTLPVWSPRFVFSPPQANPPDIFFAGKSRQWINTDKHTSTGEPIYQVDGLLLRSYEYTVATSQQTSYYLPLISILKGTFFHGPVIIQLPCAVQLPYNAGANAKVKYRRFQGDKDVNYGPLPGDSKIYLMPGHYDYIGIETSDEEGSSSLDLKCPNSDSLSIEMKSK
jgi:hypothetical protein